MKSQDEEFERFLQLNRDLIRDARFRGHDRRNGRELADLEILAGFQHYGAATCLIDFTYNPLVALWFACKPESDNPSKKCCSCNQKPKISPIAGKVVAVRPNDFREFREITLDSLQKGILMNFSRDNEGNMCVRGFINGNLGIRTTVFSRSNLFFYLGFSKLIRIAIQNASLTGVARKKFGSL